jgi:hypothetical protein
MKRSAHVALLLMGTAAVGGTAYSVMPSETCSPDRPGIATADGRSADCVRRSSSGGSGGGGSRWSGSHGYGLFGGGSASTPAASSSSPAGASSASPVSRGGFGSFARAFAGHFSGGG